MRSNWKKVTLGELQTKGLAKIQTGPFGTVLKASEYSDFGVPIISVGEIRSGYLEISERTPMVSEEIAKRLPQFVLATGDIVFGRKGAIDRNSIINERQHGWFLGSDGIMLRLSDKINSVFVSYQLRSNVVGKWLLQNSSGSIMPSLNQKILDRLPLWLPELSVQNKIASTLSSIDQKIELNNRINAELEAMAKLIYDYWFVQFDFPISKEQVKAMDNPKLEGKPYKASGGKMVWSEELKREVPEGWGVNPLKQFARTGSGGTPKSTERTYYDNGDVPWINSGEVNQPFIVSAEKFITKAAMQNSSAKLFEKGTILMAMYGATAAKVSIIDIEACTNQAICAIVPNKSNKVWYLKHCLENMYRYLINLSSGSARDNLSQNKIRDLQLLLPPEKMLTQYHIKVEPTMLKILINLRENRKLAEMRDWLLPMLMNGQVGIKDVEKRPMLDSAT